MQFFEWSIWSSDFDKYKSCLILVKKKNYFFKSLSSPRLLREKFSIRNPLPPRLFFSFYYYPRFFNSLEDIKMFKEIT